MSIISWTSPSPSERILPASIDTSVPRSCLVLAQQLAELAHELRRAPVPARAPLRNAS